MLGVPATQHKLPFETKKGLKIKTAINGAGQGLSYASNYLASSDDMMLSGIGHSLKTGMSVGSVTKNTIKTAKNIAVNTRKGIKNTANTVTKTYRAVKYVKNNGAKSSAKKAYSKR